MDFTKLKYLIEKLWKAVYEKNEGLIKESTDQLLLFISDYENVALAHGLIENQTDVNKRTEISEKINENVIRVRQMKKELSPDKVTEVFGATPVKEPTPPQPTVVSNGGGK